MARKDNPMLVRCEGLGQLAERIRTRYKLGTHDCCAMLQCSRDWWTSNVKPHVHYVYASSRAITAFETAGAPALSHPDHCWYDASELIGLLAAHTRIERRTKRVPLEAYLADAEAYRRRLEDERATDAHIAALVGGDRRRAEDRQRQALADCLGPEGLALLAEAINLKAARRPLYPYAAVGEDERAEALSALRRGGWRTVGDMMEYGDAAETHYRRLFADGALRCTIEVPQAGGGATRHVMWCADPFPVAAPAGFEGVSERWATVPAEAWHKVGR